jgi:hypothetical protein
MNKRHTTKTPANRFIPTGSSRCKKAVNDIRRVHRNKRKMGVVSTKGDLYHLTSLATLQEFNKRRTAETPLFTSMHNGDLLVSHHLSRAEKYLSDAIVSKENFENIQRVSRFFPGNLTTFLGFETRLGEQTNKADFAFAISGIGKDRDILKDLLENNDLAKGFLKHSEWKHISDFAKSWSDPTSEISDKIRCFWLEFDRPGKTPDLLVPSVFFGPTKTENNDPSQYTWVTEIAIPLLKGQKISEEIAALINNCLRKMPKNATLFQVGTMLSRNVNAIRLHIKMLHPDQIIPYIKDIGWKHDTIELYQLLDDFKDLVDRFVISYDITDEGINSKIGIELSFSGNNFQNEQRWEKLLDYLVEKEMCIPEKRNALLSYTSVDEKEAINISVMNPIISATGYSDDLNQSKVVRYINHIKIVFEPEKQIIVKAYPAVRLFESVDESQRKMMN